MQFKQPGPWLFALGMIGLGLVEIVLGSLPGLHPGGWGFVVLFGLTTLVGALLSIAGAGLLAARSRRYAGLLLAGMWVVCLVPGYLPLGETNYRDVSVWVSMTEVTVFAAISLVLSGAVVRAVLVARVILGLSLILFGAVHWLYPVAIAGLMPDWIPTASLWPWLTGGIQIGAGLMILSGWRAALAAFGIGLMWLSWIPLVHLPRLIAAPGDAFEWTFMLTALTLAGAAWTVGELSTAKSGEDLQPSAH